jgi:hypothetical protein
MALMPTGPEHYRAAERLLDEYRAEMQQVQEGIAARSDGGQSQWIRRRIGLAKMLLDEAQVDATLAHAAAQAYPAVAAYIGDERGLWSEQREWASATAPTPQPMSS